MHSEISARIGLSCKKKTLQYSKNKFLYSHATLNWTKLKQLREKRPKWDSIERPTWQKRSWSSWSRRWPAPATPSLSSPRTRWPTRWRKAPPSTGLKAKTSFGSPSSGRRRRASRSRTSSSGLLRQSRARSLSGRGAEAFRCRPGLGGSRKSFLPGSDPRSLLASLSSVAPAASESSTSAWTLLQVLPMLAQLLRRRRSGECRIPGEREIFEF